MIFQVDDDDEPVRDENGKKIPLKTAEKKRDIHPFKRGAMQFDSLEKAKQYVQTRIGAMKVLYNQILSQKNNESKKRKAIKFMFPNYDSMTDLKRSKADQKVGTIQPIKPFELSIDKPDDNATKAIKTLSKIKPLNYEYWSTIGFGREETGGQGGAAKVPVLAVTFYDFLCHYVIFATDGDTDASIEAVRELALKLRGKKAKRVLPQDMMITYKVPWAVWRELWKYMPSWARSDN